MSQIKTVKNASDIVDIVGERLELKRAGINLKANCPFHGEKTPSFFINEVMQRYKCFGCGESGDVINFLEKYEGMTFIEALEYLADRAGIKLEKFKKSAEDDERDKLLEVLEIAKNYYSYLLTDHKQGQNARDYVKDRGITSQSIKTFSLGYSLPGWDGLIKYLHKRKKYDLELLQKAGLVLSRSGRYYDRFRGRLMFPLKNHRGQVVGFSGRVLDKSIKQAKYINSPETLLYHKSDMLYGLSELYQEIRKKKEVVVAEGEFDVISSTQAHLNNIVAVKGSAMTPGHVRLIARIVEKVILALDRDNAGIDATKKAIEVAKESGLELRVANLDIIPDQLKGKLKDPDDIAKAKPKLWREAVQTSISIYEFLMRVTLKDNDASTPEGKREIVKKYGPILNQIEHAVERDFYLKKLAKILDVKQSVLKEDLIKISRGKKINTHGVILKSKKTSLTKRAKLERYLIFLLLNFGNDRIPDKVRAVKDFQFEDKILKKFISDICLVRGKFNLKKIVSNLPDDIKEYVSEIYLLPEYASYFKDLEINQEWDKILMFLKEDVVKKQVIEITSKLNSLEKKSELNKVDQATQLELLRKIVQLKKYK